MIIWSSPVTAESDAYVPRIFCSWPSTVIGIVSVKGCRRGVVWVIYSAFWKGKVSVDKPEPLGLATDVCFLPGGLHSAGISRACKEEGHVVSFVWLRHFKSKTRLDLTNFEQCTLYLGLESRIGTRFWAMNATQIKKMVLIVRKRADRYASPGSLRKMIS